MRFLTSTNSNSSEIGQATSDPAAEDRKEIQEETPTAQEKEDTTHHRADSSRKTGYSEVRARLEWKSDMQVVLR